MFKTVITFILLFFLVFPPGIYAEVSDARERLNQKNPEDIKSDSSEKKSEDAGTGLAVGGVLLSFCGIVLFFVGASLEAESEKPISPKYTTMYYYGYYYSVPDTDVYLREANDRKEKKPSRYLSDFRNRIIRHGCYYGNYRWFNVRFKLTPFNNKSNLFITTIDTNTPAIGIRYDF